MAGRLDVTEGEVRHAVAYALKCGRAFGWADQQITEHATSSLVDTSGLRAQDRAQEDWEAFVEGKCSVSSG